jgi:nitrate reductase beta subunit
MFMSLPLKENKNRLQVNFFETLGRTRGAIVPLLGQFASGKKRSQIEALQKFLASLHYKRNKQIKMSAVITAIADSDLSA